MFGKTSAGFNHHPHRTFANATSAPRDFNRMEMMRDRGVIYQPNGGGRDTYIYNDDGGFNQMKVPRAQFKPGTLLVPDISHAKKFQQSKNPYIHSKPIQYPQDGTGRDSYVKITNGGLSSETRKDREFRQAFKANLRTYGRIPDYLERRNYYQSSKVAKQRGLSCA